MLAEADGEVAIDNALPLMSGLKSQSQLSDIEQKIDLISKPAVKVV